MFKRRLRALDYIEWDKVNAHDQQHLRKVVAWLEDQKIRLYAIEDRKPLRETTSDKWPEAFAKYCKDTGCPISAGIPAQVEWLLGHAIWLEAEQYGNQYELFSRKLLERKIQKKKNALKPVMKSTNPLDNLDFFTPEFKKGTYSVAKVLRVPRHPNHLLTLKACSLIVQKRLNRDARRNPNSKIVRGKPFPTTNLIPNNQKCEPKLENAIKGLALLYIQDIRELQTKINEVIVGVQNYTANPKTDTRLGKVGK